MWSSVGLPEPDRTLRDPAYQRALKAIFGYSAHSRSTAEVRADRLRKVARLGELLRLLGNPQNHFDSILVGGTKGKGSTAGMLASILRAGGLRVGRYTQPHLVSWRERTWVDGGYIHPDEVVRLLPRVQAAARRLVDEHSGLGQPTTFEIGTAVSLLHFAQVGVNTAVVEVGVGGRSDATNALDPVVSVIAPVSFDHADVIGPTLKDIAREKSGIMRPGRPVIVAPQTPVAERVLRQAADATGARLSMVGREWTWSAVPDPRAACLGRAPFDIRGPRGTCAGLVVPLVGTFQRDNATAAVAAASASEQLQGVPLADVARRGLASVQWPGRIDQRHDRPIVVLDGAHNAESADRLVETLRDCFQYRRLIWIVGMSTGKDASGFLAFVLDSADEIIATAASHQRSLPPTAVARLARSLRDERGMKGVPVRAVASPRAALVRALERSTPEDAVCVAGSLFLIGELLEAPGPWDDSCALGAFPEGAR